MKVKTFLLFAFNIKKSLKNIADMSKLANVDPENLIEIEIDEIETENSKLITYLFEELESELT